MTVRALVTFEGLNHPESIYIPSLLLLKRHHLTYVTTSMGQSLINLKQPNPSYIMTISLVWEVKGFYMSLTRVNRCG